jgi:hypothetical protein
MMTAPKTIEFMSRETAELVVDALRAQGYEAAKTGIEVFTDAPFTRTQMVELARIYLPTAATINALRTAIETVDRDITEQPDSQINWDKLNVLVDMRRDAEPKFRRAA